MRFKGRHWLIALLAGFLAVAGTVSVRQQSALRAARALEEARNERAALQGRRAELERSIRVASTREALGSRVARRVGLRPAADSEIVMLRVPQLDER